MVFAQKSMDLMIIQPTECICCSFTNVTDWHPAFPHGRVEVYYGSTENFISNINKLADKLSFDEKERASKFLSDSDRNTYIACHSYLRIILSLKLGRTPSQIEILADENNKPYLKDNPLYFNVSHDRDAFAFVISEFLPVGIDIEKIKPDIDYSSLFNSVLSRKEISYVRDNLAGSPGSFFLLWTRKEALLKAIGTGIIEDLNKIYVSDSVNEVNEVNLDNFNLKEPQTIFKDYFIYSLDISDSYLSIALPQKETIRLRNIEWKCSPALYWSNDL